MGLNYLYKSFRRVGFTKATIDCLFSDEIYSNSGAKDYELLIRHIANELDLHTITYEKTRLEIEKSNLDIKVNSSPFADNVDYTSTVLLCKALGHKILEAYSCFERSLIEEIIAAPSLLELDELIHTLSLAGVPVVPVSKIHNSFKKPHSILMVIDGRPIIYLGDRCSHKVKVIFTVLHCLVSFLTIDEPLDVCINEGNTLFDFHFNIENEMEDSVTTEVLKLMSNSSNLSFDGLYDDFSPISIAYKARKLAVSQKVTPGFLLAQFANETFSWDLIDQSMRFLPEIFFEQELLHNKLSSLYRSHGMVELSDLEKYLFYSYE